MVTTSFTRRLVQQLEMYLLQINGFQLRGEGYDMILFLPNEGYTSENNYSLLISAKALDKYSQKEVITRLLTSFKNVLGFDEYNTISTLNVVESTSSLVKNINFAFPFYRSEDAEIIINTTIGEFALNNATLVRSSVLTNLVSERNVRIRTASGRYISGSVQRIDTDFRVYLAPTPQQAYSSGQPIIDFSEIDTVSLLPS